MATAKIAPPLERQYYNGAEKYHAAGCNGMPRFVNGILFLMLLVSFLTVVHAQQAHPFSNGRPRRGPTFHKPLEVEQKFERGNN
jgi:hypothetical protein